ncbi:MULTISPECIES: TetR family transcriptional regulator [unclassified Streptomyces]|uniref:TetR family transcriptional regulator n=1 Tax=unclassified Streptomyces TaxID=2593676 RepID=UPI0003628E8A|nr:MULTISPECIES: TetR family transcriptional regulator [unclassified Streptomyces]MYT28363.1 TetR family transcriptional regulator [Streptomyces sp. SID8354]
MAGLTPQTAPTGGLRERKKQRTRDALIRAALELFTEHGYETTTVDEIAEAVDVSQRTFFRYFANKQEVAFAVQDMVEARFLEELRARPAAEPPLTALRRAVMAAWDEIGSALASVIPVDLHMRTFQMIESTPALVAAHLRRSTELEEQIAQLIARREGLDVDADPRPRVLVAAFSGVLRVAGKVWGEGQDCSVEAIRELTESYLDHIGPAIEMDRRADRNPRTCGHEHARDQR